MPKEKAKMSGARWLIGVLVLVAVAASASTASAQPEFQVESEAPATVKTTGVFSSVINGVTIECETAHYHQEETGWWIFSKTKFRLSTTGPCTMGGLLEASVNAEECEVFLTPEEKGGGAYTGSLDFSCPEGQSIKMSVATCAAEIVPQEGLTAVSFVNASEGSTAIVEWTPEVTGMEYVVTKDGFLCPFSGTGSGSDGVFSTPEALTMHAEVSETPVGIAIVGE